MKLKALLTMFMSVSMGLVPVVMNTTSIYQQLEQERQRREQELKQQLKSYVPLIEADIAAERVVEESIKHFRDSIGKTHFTTQYNLVLMQLGQSNDTIDVIDTINRKRKEAEQGDYIAQYFLGLLYYIGRVVPQNRSEAYKWFNRSAIHEYENAQYSLGWMNNVGEGIIQDTQKAVKLYFLSAEKGNVFAQLTLGCSYYLGEGVPRNIDQAYFWLLLGCAKSNEDLSEDARGIRDMIATKLSVTKRDTIEKQAREYWTQKKW